MWFKGSVCEAVVFFLFVMDFFLEIWVEDMKVEDLK